MPLPISSEPGALALPLARALLIFTDTGRVGMDVVYYRGAGDRYTFAATDGHVLLTANWYPKGEATTGDGVLSVVEVAERVKSRGYYLATSMPRSPMHMTIDGLLGIRPPREPVEHAAGLVGLSSLMLDRVVRVLRIMGHEKCRTPARIRWPEDSRSPIRIDLPGVVGIGVSDLTLTVMPMTVEGR